MYTLYKAKIASFYTLQAALCTVEYRVTKQQTRANPL